MVQSTAKTDRGNAKEPEPESEPEGDRVRDLGQLAMVQAISVTVRKPAKLRQRFHPARLRAPLRKLGWFSQTAAMRRRPLTTSFRGCVEVVVSSVAALRFGVLFLGIAHGGRGWLTAVGVKPLDAGDTAEDAFPGMTSGSHK